MRVRRITEFMAKCFWGRIESYLDQYSYSHLQSRDATCRVSWKLIEKQEVLYRLSQDASKLSILDFFECEEDSSSRDKFDY